MSWQGNEPRQAPPATMRLPGGFDVVSPGFEPGQTEPKSVVLPLHHETILILLWPLSGYAGAPDNRLSA